MIVIQATGFDPGMEIIRKIWPDEEPFATPRHVLLNTLKDALTKSKESFAFDGISDDYSLFTYHLHSMPEEVNNIGTSTLLAAWNAAVYVAQIDENRLTEALRKGTYIKPTEEVVQKYGGLWFQDESFVVVRLK